MLKMAADIVSEHMRDQYTISGDGPVFELICRVLKELKEESGPIAQEARQDVERRAGGAS